MANPMHVHWLRHYHPETRWGETYCGFQGTYKAEFKFLMFKAFHNRGVEVFNSTTAFCEVTCAKCARYRLSHSKIEVKVQKTVIVG